MRADNSAAIITAARNRSQLTRSKTIRALRELDAAGTPVSFEAIARAAGVSRSWLYAQPDIRAEIQRLRQATRRAPSPAIPAAQRATDASLHTRLRAALDRNRELAEENQRLRRQLAQALGQQRSSPHGTKHDMPSRNPPGTSPSANDQRLHAEAQHRRATAMTTPSATQQPGSQP